MNILIAGGSGFLGRSLTSGLIAAGENVWILSRQESLAFSPHVQVLRWDGRSPAGWGQRMNDMDVVVHLAGRTLASWPWTASKRRVFHDSRVLPGQALVASIAKADRKPRLFIQQSGVNFYGLRGSPADESTPPETDYLSRLTVQVEDATRKVEDHGVRHIALRSAVVISRMNILLRLMALPVYLFLGGPIGSGKQAMPWIHVQDWVNAVLHLIRSPDASGAYNLISPTPTSNADFYRALARALHRPYWFPVPALPLRIFLGEMSVMIVDGRFVSPKRLLEAGFKFKFANLDDALSDLYG